MAWWAYPLNPYPMHARALIRAERQKRGLTVPELYDAAGLAGLISESVFAQYESDPTRTIGQKAMARLDTSSTCMGRWPPPPSTATRARGRTWSRPSGCRGRR